MTPARPSRAIYAAVGALVAISAGILTTAGAGAQSGPCSNVGLKLARVSIDQPSGGAVTSPVTVRGRAEANGLTRAELFAGTERVASSQSPEPKSVLPFEFRWDAKGRAGQVTLRVVACGTGGSLVWGDSSVSVDLRPPAPTTTAAAPPPPQPAPPPSPPQTVTTTAAPVRPATASTVAAAKTGSTKAATTTTAVPDESDVDEEAAALAPSSTVPTRPFVLTEGTDAKKPNRPLWVGVVVGLSGVAGLTFSAVFRWRRNPLPEVVEEPDLVDVR